MLLRHRLAVFLDHQRAKHRFPFAAAADFIRFDAGEHLLEIGACEKGLEVLGDLADRGFVRLFRRRRTGLRHRAWVCRVGWGCGDRVHWVTMSAWRAPAALIDCRIEIRSRGPTPSELMPVTSCSRVRLVGSTASLRFLSSCTSTSVRGTTTVTPVEENGEGCETWGVSVTRMVRLPCATATLLIRTFSPITMTPVFSSTTTRAC